MISRGGNMWENRFRILNGRRGAERFCIPYLGRRAGAHNRRSEGTGGPRGRRWALRFGNGLSLRLGHRASICSPSQNSSFHEAYRNLIDSAQQYQISVKFGGTNLTRKDRIGCARHPRDGIPERMACNDRQRAHSEQHQLARVPYTTYMGIGPERPPLPVPCTPASYLRYDVAPSVPHPCQRHGISIGM